MKFNKKLISVFLLVLFSLFVAAETVTVNIQNNQFVPASIEITVGDTVKWTNNDEVEHKIVGSGFSSNNLKNGEDFSSTFNVVEVVPYSCGIHPDMQGSISVLAAGQIEEQAEEEQVVEEEEEEVNPFSEDFAVDDNSQYACWNSEYLAPKQKVMNIDFEVSYNETQPIISLHDFQIDLKYVTNFVSVTDVTLEWKCIAPKTFSCAAPGGETCYCLYKSSCYKYNGEIDQKYKCIANSQINQDNCVSVKKNKPGESCKVVAWDDGWDVSCSDDEWSKVCDIGPYHGNNYVKNDCDECEHGIYKIDTRLDLELFPDDYHEFLIDHSINIHDHYYWIEDEEQAVKVSLPPTETPLEFPSSPESNKNIINSIRSEWVSGEFVLDRDDFWDKESFDEPNGEVTLDFDFKCRVEGNSNFGVCTEELKEAIDPPYFFNPKDPSDETEYQKDGKQVIEYKDLLPGENKFKVIVEINNQYNPVVLKTETIETKSVSYACPKGKECLYPLPGDFPYTITNSHPELYDLYFVSEDKEILITGDQTFNEKGNILAKRVSSQVILSVDPETDNLKFYGCSSASYLEAAATNEYFTSLQHCSIQAGNFCSYSETNDDGETIVNTWSTEEISTLGYEIPEGEDPNIGFSFSLRDPLSPKIAPNLRTELSKVFPTQNILSNALFEISSGELLNWKYLKEDGTINEHLDVDNETIVLNNNEKLISERISVPKNTNFNFQQDYGCQPDITQVGNDGPQEELTTLPEFNTAENSFIIVEFNGPCSIKHPIIQRVHENVLPFTYNEFLTRSGAACCQVDGCWNGYSCVEEMSQYTFLSEHLSDGRDYRCIEGQWKLLPAQMDWNANVRGFCSDETSCLVAKSVESDKLGQNPSDIYQGKIPICIKDKEYVFDHYCEKGNWTSRTKYLAQAIVEAANNKGEEYSLYCNSPRPMNSILELDGKNILVIGGEDSQSTQENTGAALVGQQEQNNAPITKTCFKELNDEIGTNLIPAEENTCINNVCVVKFKSSGKTAFATTLNQNITGKDSFLKVFDINPLTLDESCPVGDGFVECNFDNLEGDFWYHRGIDAVIYGKDGFDLEPGFFNNVLNVITNFWKDLFNLNNNEEIPEEEEFLQKVMDLNKVFVLKTADKTIRAVMERPSNKKELLVAEYEGFETPICEYVYKRNMPEMSGFLKEVAEGKNIVCNSTDNEKTTIKTNKNTLFWWPELTGKLRVE